MMPLCLDIKAAAASIGMSTSVLRSYIDAGLLPTIRFPSQKHDGETSRRILIAVSDLETFVQQYRVVEGKR